MSMVLVILAVLVAWLLLGLVIALLLGGAIARNERATRATQASARTTPGATERGATLSEDGHRHPW